MDPFKDLSTDMENSKPTVLLKILQMFLLKRLLAHKYPKQIKIPPVPSPVEVRGPPITPQLLQRQRWSNFVNHKIVARGIADDNRRSQEEAESQIDKKLQQCRTYFF